MASLKRKRGTTAKITLYRTALRICPRQLDRSAVMHDLSALLFSRFQRLGAMSDLEGALSLERHVLEHHSEGHPTRAVLLSTMGSYLYYRYHLLKELLDLDQAISLERSALELRPQGDADRAHSLTNIAFYLHTRFKELGVLSDLDEALSLHVDALELRPEGDPYQAQSVHSIANCLYSRFNLLGMQSDLDEALALPCNAWQLGLQGYPLGTLSCRDMASYFCTRFQLFGTSFDLDEALALERRGLKLLSKRNPDRATSLTNIAFYLYSRFKQLGTLSDLHEAIILQRDALAFHPEGHPHRPLSLRSLAKLLHACFLELGAPLDLNAALSLQRNALELCPVGHPQRALHLVSVAGCLYSRFQFFGTLVDLDEAIILGQEALELRPDGHPDRADSLISTAALLYSRFHLLGTLVDLDEALTLERDALQLRLRGHSARASSLENVATCLRARFDQLGMSSELDEAVYLQRSALELRPEWDPCLANSFSNLASYLYTRFERFEVVSDLDEAISLERDALQRLSWAPRGHPARAPSLSSITTLLYARFHHSSTTDANMHVLDEIFSLYVQLSNHSQVVCFLADLKCAKQWIQAAEDAKHSSTVLAYQIFFRFCVQHLATVPPVLQPLFLIKELVTSVAVDAFSASIRYFDPKGAAELLEQGRDIVWNQLTRFDSSVSEVLASGKAGAKMARKFTELAGMLRAVLSVSADVESQRDLEWGLGMQLQGLISEIRALPGLSGFLKPPLFSCLRVAAVGGPVVLVNASRHSCDALIILPDHDPVHVALSITKTRASKLSFKLGALTSRAKSQDVQRDLVVLLRELWDDVVFPVVQVLQKSCPPRSRIWWCPTAEFSLLPLHAAGPYRKDQPNLADLYISSYTPTLMSLLRARQHTSTSTKRPRVLLVGYDPASEQHGRLSVDAELSRISQCIGSAATLTCLRDQDATVDRVSDALQTHAFVHLACHGTVQDLGQPFASGFCVQDGLLQVDAVVRIALRHPLCAFLSACHAARVDAPASADDFVPLPAAMQLAGFRSVVGTMWAADDAYAGRIASGFYARLLDGKGRLDHTRAALALHETMEDVRGTDIPFDQHILYVHVGV